MLEETGRHMSSQRQEQAFQVCTLSTLYPIQAELGMLKEGDGEQVGMCCRASARLSTRSKARECSVSRGRELRKVRFKDREENYSGKSQGCWAAVPEGCDERPCGPSTCWHHCWRRRSLNRPARGRMIAPRAVSAGGTAGGLALGAVPHRGGFCDCHRSKSPALQERVGQSSALEVQRAGRADPKSCLAPLPRCSSARPTAAVGRGAHPSCGSVAGGKCSSRPPRPQWALSCLPPGVGASPAAQQTHRRAALPRGEKSKPTCQVSQELPAGRAAEEPAGGSTRSRRGVPPGCPGARCWGGRPTGPLPVHECESSGWSFSKEEAGTI